MKIVVVGAGEVGRQLCQTLSLAQYNVTMIEAQESAAFDIEDAHNVRVIVGNGASASVLSKAGVSDCDCFLAMTSDDRTNVLASSLAKALKARTTVARIHDQTYSDGTILNYQAHFGIDSLINPEALCAVELAKAIRNEGRVAVENFARGQIEVQQVQVSRHSRFCGQTLRTIRLEPGIRVGIIQRDGVDHVPLADSDLQAGDRLTLVGPPEALFELRQKLDPESRVDGIQRIVLFGGTETAIALIRLLKNPKYKIRLIETDKHLCQNLAAEFPQVTVIQGSATSLRLLEEEQIGSADYFIACTKDDEENIMTSLQARKLGVPHVLLLFNKPDYEDVLNDLKSSLGFELAVSPRQATVSEIMRYLSREPYVELAKFSSGRIRVLEIRVCDASPALNRPLKDLPLPRSAVIVALLHQFEVKVPGAEDCIRSGDKVVVLVQEDAVKELLALLIRKC